MWNYKERLGLVDYPPRDLAEAGQLPELGAVLEGLVTNHMQMTVLSFGLEEG